MDYTIFLPVIIAFALSAVMGPLIIPVLRRLKMDQTEREDGVKSHLKKAGTPTMGGVMILLSVVITSVFYKMCIRDSCRDCTQSVLADSLEKG